MYKIIKKQNLNPAVTLMEISAPAVAKKAEPGQFIILRTDSRVSVFLLLSLILTGKKALLQ